MTSNIKTMYRKLENDRVHQGDILKDFDIPFIISKPELSTESTKPPYSIIISQDCDLDGISKINDSLNNKSEEELINGNKFLPSIIIAPLYEADE